MKYNFFKKHLTTIVIIIFCIIIITTIIFLPYKSKNNNNKQKLELPILEQKNQEPIYEEQNKESQSSKKTIKVILLSSSNPFESIQNWKKDKTIIIKSPFKWKIENDNYALTQTVETKDTIYHINCCSTYKEKLDQWKNQCYFKPGNTYNGFGIRNKTEANKLYTDSHVSSIHSYKHDREIYPYTSCDDNYVYVERKFGILAYVGLDLEISGSNTNLRLDYARDWRFDGYFDTTKPPQKPTTN